MENNIKQSIACPKCGAEYVIVWDQDEWGELDLTPNFCPNCGRPIDEIDDTFDEDE
jgi:predicted RNA-binding Zn-ribbon protein involved in translation (DUF1610 family)